MVKRHNKVILALAAVSDGLAALVAWVVAYYLRYLGGRLGWTPHDLPPVRDLLFPVCSSVVLTVVVFGRFDLYGSKRTKTLAGEAADLARAVAIVWALTYIVVNFTQRTTISRILMLSLLASWVTAAVLSRLVARGVLRWLRRRGWNVRRAAIVGTGRLAQKLYHALQRNPWTGVETCYFIDDDPARQPVLGKPVYGPLAQAGEVVLDQPVDVVFVALPEQGRSEMEGVLNRLSATTADLCLVPDLLSLSLLRQDVSQLDDLPLISLTYSPQHGWKALIKRALDLVLTVVALALLAVPMLIIALLIKLTSRGPVFYRQVRTSLDGRPFRLVKFRSMVPDAEARTGPVWASPDDARTTPVGRLLRRMSLDELPQLFNVLGGQMSLVGPRPERPELIERFRDEIPRYMLRQHVKAGLTGWAQVHGFRGQTSLRKRVQYDLYYITHWSLGLDLRILLMTPYRGLIHPNAR